MYPKYCGGLPLAEVLTSTELVVITDVKEDDPLNVQHSTADVILYLDYKVNKETCSKLVKALHSAQANLLALRLGACDEINIYDLNEELQNHIYSLHPQPQLISCSLDLSKCKHLNDLQVDYCDLSSRLQILLSDPLPQLRVLELWRTGLCAEDVEQIAECVRHNKLPHLRKLNMSCNSVGEAAVRVLLEAFLSTRRQSEQLSDHVTNVRNEYTPHAPSHKAETHSDHYKVDKLNNMGECCDDVSGDEDGDDEDEKLVLELRGTAALVEEKYGWRWENQSDEFIEEVEHKLQNTFGLTGTESEIGSLPCLVIILH